jgi:surface antigen
MRTFHWNAPIIIGAGALVLSLISPAPPSPHAEEHVKLAAAEGGISPTPKPTLAELRARLDETDRALAVKALGLALNELGDGATLVWRRPERSLVGKIKPSAAFRDKEGRICRHVNYAITLGDYAKQVEGVACRQIDGEWSLEG